jgi:hypothetical protein
MQRDNTEWWVYSWKCLTFGCLATTGVSNFRLPNNDSIRPNTSQYHCKWCNDISESQYTSDVTWWTGVTVLMTVNMSVTTVSVHNCVWAESRDDKSHFPFNGLASILRRLQFTPCNMLHSSAHRKQRRLPTPFTENAEYEPNIYGSSPQGVELRRNVHFPAFFPL